MFAQVDQKSLRNISRSDIYLSVTAHLQTPSQTNIGKTQAPHRPVEAGSIDILEVPLGAVWIGAGDFPDNKIDSIPIIDVIKFIESFKDTFYPNIIYVHSPTDLNIDHRIAASATLTAYRPEPKESYEEIRFYEVASSTDYTVKQLEKKFEPNLYINIDAFIEKKISALKFYDMEMRENPHSRSYEKIQSLAQHRGSESGMNYAEAFEVVRRIIR